MIGLSEIASIKRVGPLLELSSLDLAHLTDLEMMAVCGTGDPNRFQGLSASSVAAWLLLGAHDNALGTGPQRSGSPSLQGLFGRNRLLGYRGQADRYSTIVPTLFRLSGNERSVHKRARIWFHTALSAWHNTHFRYVDGERHSVGVEQAPATGVAQHYGLGTDFVDWTWDPLIALAFGVADLNPGDIAAVFVKVFGPSSTPHEHYNVFLPPTFAGRIWRQRGFFTWHPVPPEHFSDAEVVLLDGGRSGRAAEAATYHRVSFPVDAADIQWAQSRVRELYLHEHTELEELTHWALIAAATSHRPPNSQGRRIPDYLEMCSRLGLAPPRLLTAPPLPELAAEDVPEMMDYFDMMALRQRPHHGGLAYHKPSLLTAFCGLPTESFPGQPNNLAAAIDPRAAAFASAGRSCHRWTAELVEFDPERDLHDPAEIFFVDRPAPAAHSADKH